MRRYHWGVNTETNTPAALSSNDSRAQELDCDTAIVLAWDLEGAQWEVGGAIDAVVEGFDC